jgi:2-polyprenyl-6-methoxyphenol hydroxylase-like FAD-dependent oxidoreductase
MIPVAAHDLTACGAVTSVRGVRAVVIGGGIGGLLAAHALADLFEQVTLLERSRYPVRFDTPAPPARRGAPQSRCLHMLMAGGAVEFDGIVPGWRAELVRRGAVAFDASADTALHMPGGWLPRAPSGIISYACSRTLIEAVLRDRLAARPSVHVFEGRRVLGLLATPRGDRIVGVRVAGARIEAELVVDASGRGSLLPSWLASLPGAVPVAEMQVPARLRYASRWVHLAPCDAPGWHCFSMAIPTDGGRAAMMLRAEGDCWGVVLLATAGEGLPSDDGGFLDFTGGLGEGELHAVLRRARPVSPIHRYGATRIRLRQFDRLAGWPAGLAALGDAVCALDPVHGLGMTLAARGVACLRRHVDAGAPGFQRALAAVNAQAWGLATGRDPDGRPVPGLAADLGRVAAAAARSPAGAHALLGVQHLLRPVASLATVGGS